MTRRAILATVIGTALIIGEQRDLARASARRMALEEIETSAELTQQANSPIWLNCAGRLVISNCQGTCLARARTYIRDPTGEIEVSETSGDYGPVTTLELNAGYDTLDSDLPGTWNCTFEAEVILDYQDPITRSSFSQDDVCPGVRGGMKEEYRAGQVNLNPACSDFTNSGGSAHFSWSELNGGFSGGNPHNPWGMIRTALTNGLVQTRTNYARGGIRLSSGYRCPHGNANSGGEWQSYHMHGRAADMFSSDHTWTEEEFNLLKDAADDTGPIESLFWHTYPNDRHYHAAW